MGRWRRETAKGGMRPMDSKKWYWLIAVPVLFVGLSACAGEVVGSSEEALDGPRPFSASFEGQLSFVGPFEPGSLDRCNANLFPEGEFPGHFISGFDTASGIGRHLGSFSLTSSFCVSFESPLSPQGEATFTA